MALLHKMQETLGVGVALAGILISRRPNLYAALMKRVKTQRRL
jgi:hypothetical protein